MVCYRQQLTVWPGKLILCKKNPLKISYFCVHESELPYFGRPWTANGWFKAYPWKLGGMTVQNSYVVGRWLQNWAYTSPQHFLCLCTEIGEKVHRRDSSKFCLQIAWNVIEKHPFNLNMSILTKKYLSTALHNAKSRVCACIDNKLAQSLKNSILGKDI